MSEQNNSSPPSNDTPNETAAWRKVIWGDAQDSFRRRSVLADKLAHKSLNIPYTDGISVDNSKSSAGIPGWTIPATALIAAATYLGHQYLNSPSTTPTISPAVDIVVEPPPSTVP